MPGTPTNKRCIPRSKMPQLLDKMAIALRMRCQGKLQQLTTAVLHAQDAELRISLAPCPALPCIAALWTLTLSVKSSWVTIAQGQEACRTVLQHMPIELITQHEHEKICKADSEVSNKRKPLLRKAEDDLESSASNVLSNSRTQIVVSPCTIIHSSFGTCSNCYGYQIAKC